ncbi:uncharacterized protein LOC134439457 [Engraulis encrasicolus]|uniref:uncharacterized protein LOC134439457 n=1 Tax=Engraulis encrasicolus TaxID=184585 RepID=UPI002FD20757
MAAAAGKRQSANRNIVYCLRCHKPQDNLPVHLVRVCMKNCTLEDRETEVARAVESNREWVRANRTWDYNAILELLPHRRCRMALVEDLQERGFFIKNIPRNAHMEDPDMVTKPVVTAAAEATTSAAAATTSSATVTMDNSTQTRTGMEDKDTKPVVTAAANVETTTSAATVTMVSRSAATTDPSEGPSSESDKDACDASWTIESPDPVGSLRLKRKAVVLEEPVIEDQPVEPTYEVVKAGTKRGRPQLIDNVGNSFGVAYRGPSAVTWRCSVRPKGAVCRAKVVERDGVFEAGQYPHNHEPDLGTATAAKLTACMEKEAVVIVQEVSLDELQENVPRPELSKSVNLSSVGGGLLPLPRPCEPKDIHFIVNMDHIPPSFLRGDVRVSGDNERRHLIFATDTQLTRLANAKTWYLEGNSKLCGPPFTQLFTIGAFVRQKDCTKSVPLLFVLMSRCKKKDYKRVLREILDILPRPPKVTRAMHGFEKSLWSAMSRVLPHVRLTGCMFHWKQAVFHKIRELGLRTKYMQRGEGHEFLRDTMSLPFLPGEHIPAAWERLKSRASTPGLQDFTSYMDSTWMNSPIHPPTTWSVFKKTVRTNNEAKGWHAALKRRASGESNLPFYSLVSLLQEEAKFVHLDINLVRNMKLSRYQRPARRRAEERLFDAWTRFEKGELSADELLRFCHSFGSDSASHPSSNSPTQSA